ncbi:MAG: succinate dehydrogenase, hydrophobic membrane anchor protein [Devosia sp.]|nr:succinate dehydrogenase, hydrophobic membrane anchor protein [Devosia sp.]
MSNKPTRAEIRNPATHYGATKASTRHFLTQRVTGALNIVFTLFLAWLVVSLAGADAAGKLALVRAPLVALTLALLLVVVAIHMRNGMRDVIEDYVDGAANRLALIANTAFTVSVAVVALGALAKIVFWG